MPSFGRHGRIGERRASPDGDQTGIGFETMSGEREERENTA